MIWKWIIALSHILGGILKFYIDVLLFIMGTYT